MSARVANAQPTRASLVFVGRPCRPLNESYSDKAAWHRENIIVVAPRLAARHTISWRQLRIKMVTRANGLVLLGLYA